MDRVDTVAGMDDVAFGGQACDSRGAEFLAPPVGMLSFLAGDPPSPEATARQDRRSSLRCDLWPLSVRPFGWESSPPAGCRAEAGFFNQF
jgi:hypothetical protein